MQLTLLVILMDLFACYDVPTIEMHGVVNALDKAQFRNLRGNVH